MTLDLWIERASRGLAVESAARVRTEIEEHYRAALEEPFATEMAVVEALGDSKVANRAYKQVLLTAFEARRLQQAVRSERWRPIGLAVFALLLVAPFLGVPTEAPFRPSYTVFCAGELLVAALAYFVPVLRGRKLIAYLAARWIWVGGFVGLTTVDRFWFPITILAAVAGALLGWTNARLRRKLPVEQWPKAIYLF